MKTVDLRPYIVLLSIGFLVLLVNYFKLKNELVKCQTDTYSLQGSDISKAELEMKLDSVQIVADSLFNENFPCQIELGRHQVAWEIFNRRNPKAAQQYADIISNETE